MISGLAFVLSFFMIGCESKSKTDVEVSKDNTEKCQMDENESERKVVEETSVTTRNKPKYEIDAEMFMDTMAKFHMAGNESGRKVAEQTWEEYLDKLPPEDRIRAAEYAVTYALKKYPDLK